MQEILDQIWISILLGTYVGVIPVYLGFFFLPILKRLSKKSQILIISVSIGVLIFLFVDVMAEAIEFANKLIAGLLIPRDGQAEVPGFDKFLFDLLGLEISRFLGAIIFMLGISLGVLFLIGTEIWMKSKNTKYNKNSLNERENNLEDESYFSKYSIAFIIAIGIGLHNLGEGLAVGVAYGTGDVTLATALIFGFAIHNVTEGVAITGPIADKEISYSLLFVLGAIAGFPTIIGTLLGIFVFSNAIIVLFFSLAAGSLLYVVLDITASIGKEFKENPWNYFAILFGIFIMYITSIFVIL